MSYILTALIFFFLGRFWHAIQPYVVEAWNWLLSKADKPTEPPK